MLKNQLSYEIITTENDQNESKTWIRIDRILDGHKITVRTVEYSDRTLQAVKNGEFWIASSNREFTRIIEKIDEAESADRAQILVLCEDEFYRQLALASIASYRQFDNGKVKTWITSYGSHFVRTTDFEGSVTYKLHMWS